MKVNSDPGFWEFHQKGLIVDHVRSAETWEGDKAWKEQMVQDQKEVVEDRLTTDLSAMAK